MIFVYEHIYTNHKEINTIINVDFPGNDNEHFSEPFFEFEHSDLIDVFDILDGNFQNTNFIPTNSIY